MAACTRARVQAQPYTLAQPYGYPVPLAARWVWVPLGRWLVWGVALALLGAWLVAVQRRWRRWQARHQRAVGDGPWE